MDKIIYIVKENDTLDKISREYNISVERLKILNGLDTDELVIGQAILILYPSLSYIVREGDTLQKIADMYGTTVKDLWRANYNISGSYDIYPMQNLAIRYGSTEKKEIITNGYAYPSIDRTLLKKTLPYLTYISPFTYGFTEAGEIILLNDQPILNLAYRQGTKALMHLSTLTAECVEHNGGQHS